MKSDRLLGTSPGILNLDYFSGLGMTQGYQLEHLISCGLLKPFFDNVLLGHGGLANVFPLAVHLDLGNL